MTMLGNEAGGTERRSPTYQVLVEDMKALRRSARHENNAIAMAEGLAYATGSLGVAVIGRGPATANGLHATTYASRAGENSSARVVTACSASARSGVSLASP
jgi:hypothetical protein